MAVPVQDDDPNHYIMMATAVLIVNYRVYDALARCLASATAVVAAFLVATALMPVPRLFTVKKLVLTGWPFVVLMAAWLVARLPLSRSRSRLPAGVVAVSLAAALVTTAAVHRDDWRGLVGYANAHIPAGEHIWLDPAWDSRPYDHHNPSRTAASSEAWLDSHATLTACISFNRLELRRYIRSTG